MKIVLTPKQYDVIKEDTVYGYGDPITQILKGGSGASFKIGSSTISYNPLTRDKVEAWIKESIWHYFLDHDFYYNYCSDDMRKNYKQAFIVEILEPFLSNLDYFFMKHVIKILDMYTVNPDVDTPNFIDDFFRRSEIINEDTRLAYSRYRWSYAGEKPDPDRYEYSGKWPDVKVIPK